MPFPSRKYTQNNFSRTLKVAYLHILYSQHQISLSYVIDLSQADFISN